VRYIYFNNGFLPADASFITADDRSFRFGDGIFETILVVDGKTYDMASHLARLQNGLRFFRMELDVSGIEKICAELIAKNNLTSGYVRIIISRGENAGGMGYMPAGAKPYFIVQTVEAPSPPYTSISLAISTHRASFHIPCKTNSAALYVLAMMEAREAGCDNALILDAHGHVCETASGNIFWVKGGILCTPESSLPFVPGIIRKKIIALSPLLVQEGRYMQDDLADADEVFMTNVGGLVTRISSISPLGFASKNEHVTMQFRALVEADIKTRSPY
jgi:branched-chain amino acid aminotransferase